MSFSHFLCLVRSDLYRYKGLVSFPFFIKSMLTRPGFKFSFYFRLGTYLTDKILLRPLLFLVKFMALHCTYKYGITIPFTSQIGAGIYIGHFGTIVVSSLAKIGKNCNISQGVTIGKAHRGLRAGYPVIGNNVYIGPGAKVIGKISIGDNVAIGANCVVIDDVPANSVVVGVPGKIVSEKGSETMVRHLWNADC